MDTGWEMMLQNAIWLIDVPSGTHELFLLFGLFFCTTMYYFILSMSYYFILFVNM